MGPEHSSARLERFLQMCAEDNMFVVNLTTPANYFHALRRQIRHAVRKPLVVMTPKSLLRLREATSELDELAGGHFRHVIDDPRAPAKDEVRRVLLCTGKVYYDLAAHAEAGSIEDTAIVRLEQLYPLNAEALTACVGAYASEAEIVWVQEEPENMGAWRYMFLQLLDLFEGRRPRYAGRAASASPATGDPQAHQLEQRALIEDAFGESDD